MINVLLIIEDINYLKKIFNIFNKLSHNLRFCAVADNEEEILLSLKNHDVDIILLDSKFDKKMKHILNNKNYTIFVFKTINQNVKYFDTNERSLTISQVLNEAEKAKKIKNEQEELQKEKIQKELEYLGYNPNYNGTKYLVESIYILSSIGEEEKESCNLERDVYPIVAKKYHKTVHNIKCNIINSTDNMVYDCVEEKLNKYLGFYNYSKPGPKKVIYSVLNNVVNK